MYENYSGSLYVLAACLLGTVGVLQVLRWLSLWRRDCLMVFGVIIGLYHAGGMVRFAGGCNRCVGGDVDRDEIELRLRALPREAVVAFATRAAMRWLPFLAVEEKSGWLARVGLRQRVVFPFWKDDVRQVHLLALFVAKWLAHILLSGGGL